VERKRNGGASGYQKKGQSRSNTQAERDNGSGTLLQAIKKGSVLRRLMLAMEKKVKTRSQASRHVWGWFRDRGGVGGGTTQTEISPNAGVPQNLVCLTLGGGATKRRETQIRPQEGARCARHRSQQERTGCANVTGKRGVAVNRINMNKTIKVEIIR